MAGGANENEGPRFSIPSYMAPGSEGREQGEISERIRNLEFRPRGQTETPAPQDAPPPARTAVATSTELSPSDYESMSWGEYLPIVGSNIGPSALQALKDLGTAVMNPIDTATTVGQLGYGAAAKGIDAASEGLGFGPVFNPETAAERERVIDALLSDYASRYGVSGEEGEVWKRLAEDPAAYLADIASVATLGSGTAAKAGLIPRAGAAERATTALGGLDPAQLALRTAAQARSALPESLQSPIRTALTGAQSVATGVPTSFLRVAYDVGAGRVTPDQRAAFLTALRRTGGGMPAEITDTLRRGLDEAEEAASNAYMTSQASAFSRMQPVDMTAPRAAYDELENLMYQPQSVLRLAPPYRDADLNAANAAMMQFQEALTNPNPAARTIQELDRLKKNLNVFSRQISDPALQGRVTQLANSLVSAMSDVDPAYGDMMSGWSAYRRDLENTIRDLGSERMSDVARTRKLERQARNERADDIFSVIERTPSGATIRPMIAGEAMRNYLPDRVRTAIAAAGGPAMAAMQFGPQMLTHPLALASGAGLAAAASPRIAAATQRGLGAAARMGRNLVEPLATNPLVTNLASQIGAQIAAEQERQGRKAGGRVGVNHEGIADQLVTAAERAKKGISRDTEALLGVHDDHIATALEVANRSI